MITKRSYKKSYVVEVTDAVFHGDTKYIWLIRAETAEGARRKARKRLGKVGSLEDFTLNASLADTWGELPNFDSEDSREWVLS